MVNRNQLQRGNCVKLETGDELVGMVLLEGTHDKKKEKAKASAKRSLFMKGKKASDRRVYNAS